MTRVQIYVRAQRAEKGNWREYNNFKRMLSESLTPEQHREFCKQLSIILEV